MRYCRGFTLLELMAALVVLGILLSVGLPAFNTMIDRQRMDSAVEALVRGLNFTRMEAVRRNRPVTISPIDGDWNLGWRILIDRNDNGSHDDGETVLREDIAPAVAFIHANKPVSRYVRFNARGESILLNGGFLAGTFRFCPQEASSKGRALIINRVGRMRWERRMIAAQYCPG